MTDTPLLPRRSLSFKVVGLPAPQGSKRHVGAGRMVESSKKVAPWREDVANAAMLARGGAPALDGPLVLGITFWLPRPVSLTRAKAAMGPCRQPDLSKLVRSTEDALTTSGAIADDARIVRFERIEKRFVEVGGELGAEIRIEEAGPRE